MADVFDRVAAKKGPPLKQQVAAQAPSGGDAFDRVAASRPAGGVAPAQPEQPRGFLSNLWSDIKNIPSAITAPDPLADPSVPDTEKSRLVSQMQADAAAKNAARTQQHGLGYSLASTAGEMMGVPVSGMEQSAEQGDVGGVLGHAAFAPLMMGTSELGARVLPKVPVGRIARTGLKMGAGAIEDVPLVRQVGRAARYWKETAPPPSTPAPETISPSRTLPGMNPPEVIRPPAQPIPARSGLALPGEAPPRLADQVRQSAQGEVLPPETTPRQPQTSIPPVDEETGGNDYVSPVMSETGRPMYEAFVRENGKDLTLGQYTSRGAAQKYIDSFRGRDVSGPRAPQVIEGTLTDQVRESSNPILSRLQENAARIQAEPAEPREYSGGSLMFEGQEVPPTASLEEPLLEAVRRINAAKQASGR